METSSGGVTLSEFKAWISKFMDTPYHPATKIVPMEHDEEGYGPYKMVDDDGNVRGYCGEQTIAALRGLRARMDGGRAEAAKTDFERDYPRREIAR